MDGFTGLDIAKITSDLDAFLEEKDNLINCIGDAVNAFKESLAHNWCSPNAVKFGATFYPETMVNLYMEPEKILDEVLDDAAHAAQEMATTNGANISISKYEFPMWKFGKIYGGEGLFDTLFENAPDGTTGMNVEAVKSIRDTFTSSIQMAMDSMDGLNDHIALYDSGNTLQETYKYRINSAKTAIRDISEEIVRGLNHYIETEEDAVIQGVTTAMDMINNTKVVDNGTITF